MYKHQSPCDLFHQKYLFIFLCVDGNDDGLLALERTLNNTARIVVQRRIDREQVLTTIWRLKFTNLVIGLVLIFESECN